MAESVILENIYTGKRYTRFGKIKMKLSENHLLETTNKIIQENVSRESIILSDMSNNYSEIGQYVEKHMTRKSSPKTTSSFLKWVHVGISNSKRKFLGIHHKINKDYLQNYLDEFCYKLNNRESKDLFEKLTKTLAF